MMRADAPEQDDPQWALTLEIASRLWLLGSCTLEVAASPYQQVVNAHWAALQAGRLLGVRSKVKVIPPLDPKQPTVTVAITFDDLGGRGKIRAEEGLEKLLRSVDQHDRR